MNINFGPRFTGLYYIPTYPHNNLFLLDHSFILKIYFFVVVVFFNLKGRVTVSPLVHSPNEPNTWGWVKQKPGAWSFSQVFVGMARGHILPHHLPGPRSREQHQLGYKWAPVRDADIPRSHTACCTTMSAPVVPLRWYRRGKEMTFFSYHLFSYSDCPCNIYWLILLPEFQGLYGDNTGEPNWVTRSSIWKWAGRSGKCQGLTWETQANHTLCVEETRSRETLKERRSLEREPPIPEALKAHLKVHKCGYWGENAEEDYDIAPAFWSKWSVHQCLGCLLFHVPNVSALKNVI